MSKNANYSQKTAKSVSKLQKIDKNKTNEEKYFYSEEEDKVILVDEIYHDYIWHRKGKKRSMPTFDKLDLLINCIVIGVTLICCYLLKL